MKTLGRIINERRRKLKLTTQELADKVGVDKVRIHRIERFNSIPGSDVYSALEKSLKLSSYVRELWLKSQRELKNTVLKAKISKEFKSEALRELGLKE